MDIQLEVKKNIGILIEKGFIEEAFEVIQDYLVYDDKDVEILCFKGVIHLTLNQMNEALFVFEKALALEPLNIDVLYNLGYWYQKNNQTDKAIDYYKKSMEHSQDEELIHSIKIIIEDLERSNTEVISNELENESIDQYKKAFKENISKLIELNQITEAKTNILEFKEIVGSDPDILSIESVIAILEGHFEKAENLLLEGLSIYPIHYDLNYNLAYLYEITDKFISAYRIYKKVFKLADRFNQAEIKEKLKVLETIDSVKAYILRKKVLFVAHIFPPVGGSGVQRSLKFVKYLRDFGWEPIVVTVGKTMYPLKDESMVLEIPDEIEVIRIDEKSNVNKEYANELINFYSKVVNDNDLLIEFVKELNKSDEHLNKMLLMPDPYVLWAAEVIKVIENKVEFSEIDVVYTTSGPYSTHLLGYHLKDRFGKPWIVDFRDEWTNNPMVVYDKESIKYKMDYAFEKNVIHFSDKLIVCTEKTLENMVDIFGVDSEKVKVITNGYDEADFVTLNLQKSKGEKFTIIHNGLLYGKDRKIDVFIKAIFNLINQGFVEPNKIEVLIGYTDDNIRYKQLIEHLNLNNTFVFLDYLNHKESLTLASEADLLLLVIGQSQKWLEVPSGKIYEYLRLEKPILALSPKGSIVERLLKKANVGENYELDDEMGISKFLMNQFLKWKNKTFDTFDSNSYVSGYDRKVLTGKLSELFYSVVEEKHSRNLTVVMTTYNREKYLSQAINSILNQTYSNFYFVILDNFSSDNTENIIKSYSDSRIRYIKNSENIGFVANTNKAFDICETDYLIVVHDDDLFKPNFIETEMKIIEKNPDVSIVGSNRVYINENGSILNEMHKLNNDIVFSKYDYIKSGLTLCMPSILYRVAFIRKNNLRYKEEIGFASDTFFQYEINLLDTKIYFIKEPLVYYRIHQNQFSKDSLQVVIDRLSFSNATYQLAVERNISWLAERMIGYFENVIWGRFYNFDYNETLMKEMIGYSNQLEIFREMRFEYLSFIELYNIYINNGCLELDNTIKKNNTLLEKWLFKLSKGGLISNVLVDKNVNQIALLGDGIYCFLFIKDCLLNNIKINYIVNNNSNIVHTSKYNIPIYKSSEISLMPDNIDLIVVMYERKSFDNQNYNLYTNGFSKKLLFIDEILESNLKKGD